VIFLFAKKLALITNTRAEMKGCVCKLPITMNVLSFFMMKNFLLQLIFT